MGHHIEEKKRIEQPKRVAYVIKELNRLGYEVVQVDCTTLRFNYCGAVITVFPYTGWFTGKTVKDGRGIKNLIRQIKG